MAAPRSFRPSVVLLSSTVLAGVFFTLLYCGTVWLSVPVNPISDTYKWLLLEASPSPRLIIDSGSSGNFGVDADALGQAFGVNGINIADNAGYSAIDRSWRLLRNARSGDVVVIPLEWSGWLVPQGFDTYVGQEFSVQSSYFFSTPATSRLRRILTTPVSAMVKPIWADWAAKFRLLNNVDGTAEAIHEQALDLWSEALGPNWNGDKTRAVSLGLNPSEKGSTCQARTIGADPWILSPRLNEFFNNLKTMRRSGVRVYLAWPVVVGDDCYRNSDALTQVEAQIRAEAWRAGIPVLGSPKDFWMSKEYLDDTFYHVITSGRTIVTSRMIQLLIEAGVKPETSHLPVDTFRNRVVNQIELRERYSALELDLPPAQMIVGASNFSLPFQAATLDFTSGWWRAEDAGRWAHGSNASFRIKPAGHRSRLILKMVSAFGHRQIKVFVNGAFVGESVVTDTGSQTFEYQLSGKNQDAPMLLVALLADEAPLVSPHNLDPANTDVRDLGFLLNGVLLAP